MSRSESAPQSSPGVMEVCWVCGIPGVSHSPQVGTEELDV